MLILRQATEADLDFMTQVDLEVNMADEGISGKHSYSEANFADHRHRLATYVKGDSDAAWVFEDQESSRCVGLIICRFRDLESEPQEGEYQFLLKFLPRSLFPDDGRFTEIYQLWVDPEFRRRGLATQLKRQVEFESKRRSIGLIYTHTKETNTHVINLNLKLGYREVRRGPIGDIVRVSLTKQVI